VFVVDDDASVLRSVTRLLVAHGFETRPFQSSSSFLDQYDPDLPGCIILDLAMPGLSGLDLQPMLARLSRARQIIFISGRSDVRASVSAMKQGALDFLTKPFDKMELLTAVKEAIARDRSARKSHLVLDDIEKRVATLTPREQAVFAEVVLGKLNKQIAANLGIGEKTVKVHRARIMRKMGVRTIAELVRLADRVTFQSEWRQRPLPLRAAPA
jgi:FixJ family two-component response regulator